MSDSVQPHKWQPTRLPRPWDSPGKNTGVGCHFLLQCMKLKSESEVTQSCPTLSDPMDCSPPGSSVHGIFQASVLELGCHCLVKPEFLTGKRQQRIYKTWWPLGGILYFLIREIALNSVFIVLSSPSNRWQTLKLVTFTKIAQNLFLSL